MMIPFVLFLTHSLVRIAQSEMHTLTHTQRPVCSCFSIQTQTASAHARIYLKMKFNSACIGYVSFVRSCCVLLVRLPDMFMNIVLCVVGRLLARICVWILRVRGYEWCTVRKMLCIHELNMRDNCSVGWRVRDHIHIISMGMLVCLVAVSNSQFSLRLVYSMTINIITRRSL